MAARKGWETAQPKSEQASKNIPSGELHCQMQICSGRLMSTSSAVSWASSLPLAHASFMEVCKAKLNSGACDFLEDVHLPQQPEQPRALADKCVSSTARPSTRRSSARNNSPLVLGIKGTMLGLYTLIHL